jgi:hypothetical protein
VSDSLSAAESSRLDSRRIIKAIKAMMAGKIVATKTMKRTTSFMAKRQGRCGTLAIPEALS